MLNGLLLLVPVLVSIVSATVWVEVVAVRVHVVPGGKLSSVIMLSLEESTVSTISLVSEPSWMLVKCRYWNHFIVLTMVRISVLHYKLFTP